MRSVIIMKNKTVNAVIQARMGSTRLPGKVLMEIEGVPILEHIINRLKSVRTINKIVVATSIKPDDDAIEYFCNSQGIPCVRGSEDNVLERFGLAAMQFSADAYIRATGDNPMIDVRLIEGMLDFFDKNGLTYTCYKGFPIGSGVEIFTHEALDHSLKEAVKPFELEHVTPFMYQRMQNRNVAYYCSDSDDSKIRMTIDTESDLAFAKALFFRLYNEKPFFGVNEVKNLLIQEPDLISINMNVHQKILGE